ncbi:hypothetical protein SAMN05421693_13420 [Ectothiorhodospira magna]|uniref:Uncharacterized protein n=1 Tax=Ectothiorhodospira magna TaxID=867345 RepID=A0A1H9GAB3_9GAMM|nr:hypothetical protein [Ectothiorhodospira magna]SEQ47004.1 hypothetical protein SAMN05421693_13420 [Ectothiorhodospira magna]
MHTPDHIPTPHQDQPDTETSNHGTPASPQPPQPTENRQRCASACRGCGRHRHHPA